MIINQYLKNELNIDDNSESPNTCSENMYDDYENLNEETYNKEMSELLDYNIRIQSELYLKDDLNALCECLIEFNDKIFNNFKANPFKHYAISELALNIFRVKYLKGSKIVKLRKGDDNRGSINVSCPNDKSR